MEQAGTRIRVDKWLWAMRIFKTRSQATLACEQGRVLMDGHAVKASRLVKPGDTISIRRAGLTRILSVLQITENRLGAKLVPDYCTDLTPKEEIDAFKARISRVTIYRDPGTGRPTKKERRALDDFMEGEWEFPD